MPFERTTSSRSHGERRRTLEHVPDPAHTISEMARVASKYLLVSVPREPIWRM